MKALSLSLVLALSVSMAAVGVAPAAKSSGEKEAVAPAAETSHWLTKSSGIRHNKSCRWYKKSKGRPCTASEGRACKKCGG